MTIPTKASLIREALAQHPELGPTKIAQLIMEAHPKLNVSSQEVSTIRSKLAKQSGIIAISGRSQESILDGVRALKTAIEILGREDVKKWLEVL